MHIAHFPLHFLNTCSSCNLFINSILKAACYFSWVDIVCQLLCHCYIIIEYLLQNRLQQLQRHNHFTTTIVVLWFAFARKTVELDFRQIKNAGFLLLTIVKMIAPFGSRSSLHGCFTYSVFQNS